MLELGGELFESPLQILMVFERDSLLVVCCGLAGNSLFDPLAAVADTGWCTYLAALLLAVKEYLLRFGGL